MTKTMIVGNKDKLALEVMKNNSSSHLGFVFLYVNNIRFGFERHPYDIEEAIKNVVEYFSFENFDSKNLIDCPPTILFSAFDTCFKEDIDFRELDAKSIDNLKADKINDYYPGFYQDFLAGDELDGCRFRHGNYMFDGFSLILICKDNSLRLYIRNDSTDELADIVTTKSEFLLMWQGIKGSPISRLRSTGREKL